MSPLEVRVDIPRDVVVSTMDSETVLLNLRTNAYFGLDEIASRMWTVVTSSASINTAFETLRDEFDVDSEVLRSDLAALLAQLVECGLVELQPL